MAGISNI